MLNTSFPLLFPPFLSLSYCTCSGRNNTRQILLREQLLLDSRNGQRRRHPVRRYGHVKLVILQYCILKLCMLQYAAVYNFYTPAITIILILLLYNVCILSGNYSGFLEKKQKRFEDEKKQDDKLKKTLASELEWVRSNPKARQTKSKARLDRYEEMFTTPVREENLGFSASIYIPPGPRLGDIIIEAKGVCKAYGDKQLMKNVDFSIPQGKIISYIYTNCPNIHYSNYPSTSP